MMPIRRFHFLIHTCAVIGVLSLSGCASLFETPHKKVVKARVKKETAVKASSYIENLALAKLELYARPADLAGVSPRLTVIKDYLAQTKAQGQVVTMVVVDYTTAEKTDTQQIMAPIALSNPGFPALTKVMADLSAGGYRLQNIQVLSTQAAPDVNFVMPEEPLAIEGALDALQRRLLAQYGKLKTADEVMTQIALIEYFTDHANQDAAYMTLENVKRMLATASQDKTLDNESLATLSTKLEHMEARLKKKMPYTF